MTNPEQRQQWSFLVDGVQQPEKKLSQRSESCVSLSTRFSPLQKTPSRSWPELSSAKAEEELRTAMTTPICGVSCVKVSTGWRTHYSQDDFYHVEKQKKPSKSGSAHSSSSSKKTITLAPPLLLLSPRQDDDDDDYDDRREKAVQDVLARYDPFHMKQVCCGPSVESAYAPVSREIARKADEFLEDPVNTAIDVFPDFFVGVPITDFLLPDCVRDLRRALKGEYEEDREDDEGWHIVSASSP